MFSNEIVESRSYAQTKKNSDLVRKTGIHLSKTTSAHNGSPQIKTKLSLFLCMPETNLERKKQTEFQL